MWRPRRGYASRYVGTYVRRPTTWLQGVRDNLYSGWQSLRYGLGVMGNMASMANMLRRIRQYNPHYHYD